MQQSEKVSGHTPNNSTGSTPRVKRLPYSICNMCDLSPSAVGELYQVSFSASVRQHYGAALGSLDLSHAYRAVHPLLALGLAVAHVKSLYFEATINVRTITVTKL